MERLVVFLLCFAFAFGAVNSSTPIMTSIGSNKTATIQAPTKTFGSNKTATIQASTKTFGSNKTATIQAPTKTTKHVVAVTTMPAANATVTPHNMSATVKPSNATSTSVSPTIPPITESPAKLPAYGDYDVKNKTGYCLLAEMKVTLHVTYEIKKTFKNENTTKNATVILMAMRNTTFSMDESKCGSKNSTLVVKWSVKDPLYKLTIEFSRSKSASTNVSSWNISHITVDIKTTNNPHFLNPKDTNIIFMGSTAGSVGGTRDQPYQCSTLTYQFSDKPNNNSLRLSMDNAKLQPFGVSSKNFTGKVKNCHKPPTPTPAPSDSDIVPIAVGCALAGLVLIVLIAYIIGRRKSQRGYEKV